MSHLTDPNTPPDPGEEAEREAIEAALPEPWQQPEPPARAILASAIDYDDDIPF